MQETKTFSPKWYSPFSIHFFRLVVQNLLPSRWFRQTLPDTPCTKPASEPLKLEIVSHCWQYANMLTYQLSSFVNYPPENITVTVTVFFSEEDIHTQKTLDYFGQISVHNILWNWQPLPKEKLFRRAIGRNMAAKSTQADWVWFTDCDIIFHKDCLDSLAKQLRNKDFALCYPQYERTTTMLADSDPMLKKGSQPQTLDIDTKQFHQHARDRAKGAFQIVQGNLARAIGYCDNLSVYQTTSPSWCKCYEDRAFRWLVNTNGQAVEIKGVYQIRHIFKGRYKQNSFWSRVRSKIRRLQE